MGDVSVQGGDKQDIGGKERGMVRKWLESLMSEGRDWTMGWR